MDTPRRKLELRRWLVILQNGTTTEYIVIRARYHDEAYREALRVARVDNLPNLPDAQVREQE